MLYTSSQTWPVIRAPPKRDDRCDRTRTPKISLFSCISWWTFWKFLFFLLVWGGGRGSPRRQGGGSLFLLKIPGKGGFRGGGGEGGGGGGEGGGGGGARRVSAANCGISEKNKGGWKTQGRGKHTIKPHL